MSDVFDELDDFEELEGFEDGDEIIAEIEVIDKKRGTSRTIECVLHTDVYDLDDYNEGAIIILQLVDNSTYAGRFKSADGENVMILPLDPEDGGAGLCFDYEWIAAFFLETDNQED